MDKLEKELKAYRAAAPEPAEFVSVDEFKERFKARVANDARKPIALKLFLRAAALVAVVLTAFLLMPDEVQTPAVVGGDDVRLQEALRLFGYDSGVGFVGDELITYQRQADTAADYIIELSWMEGDIEQVVQLVSGQEDFLEFAGNGVSGSVLLSSGDTRVVSVEIVMPDGAYISQDLALGSDMAATAGDGFHVNVRNI